MIEKIMVHELSNPKLLSAAKALDTKGWIQQNDDYCYLKVDDRFIHSLYPMLNESVRIYKPDYFSEDQVGAHISVVYPEERTKISMDNIGQIHTFSITKIIKAHFGLKEYYALSITSPSLSRLRKDHQLSARPVFKGQEIMFHITIGVSN